MSLFGPGMSGVFAMLFEWVRTGRPVYVLGRGRNRVQMVSAEDVADACIRASLRPETSGQAFNIGSDPASVPTVFETVRTLVEHAGTGSSIWRIPAWTVRAGARLLGLIGLKPAGSRVLATVDHVTGDATTVGVLSGESFAGIAFSCDGTLYGVTGDGSNTPESLFIINKTDATLTFVLALGAGSDGEMIGYNPDDGFLYHGSGHFGVDLIFESIDPCTLDVTNIDISTTALIDEETQALTFWAGSETFLWKQDHAAGPLYSVSPDASFVILIGTMDHQCKGLAFLFDGVKACEDRCP